ncbi:MAG: hypothetical protein ACI9SC_002373 [Gammaproteobacteria bacterium]|jgi:hypothetical protein
MPMSVTSNRNMIQKARFCFFIVLLLSYDSGVAKTPLDLLGDNWLEVKTDNFHLITDLKQEHAKNFAKDLEQFRFFFLQLSNVKMKEDISPLKVFALANSSSYKAFKLQKNSAGIFLHRPTGNFAVANMSGYRPGNKKQNFAQQVLRHEYVHFVFDNSYNDVASPRWYQEGMAEFLSTLRVVNGVLHYGEINASRLASVDFDKKIDLEALLKADRIPESRLRGNDYYAHALTLIHYCNFHSGMEDKLLKYLKMLSQGDSVDTAFVGAFETDYETLGNEIRNYLRKKKFDYYKYEQEKPYLIGNIEISALSPELLAFYFGELMVANGLDGEDERGTAISLLEKSLQNKGQETGPAWLHLFHIQMDRGNLDAAESIFYRMEEEIPGYPGTYDAEADLFANKMEELLKLNDPEWRTYFELARGKYRTAIQLDKAFLPAYLGLGNIYFNNIDGDISLAEGISAFSEVTHFLNYPYFDYQYAVLLMRYGRSIAARNMLTKVIARTPDEKLAEIARNLKLGLFINNAETDSDL